MTSIDTAPGTTAGIKGPRQSVASPRKSKAKTDNIVAVGPAPDQLDSKPTIPITKSATVIKMLSRTKGATVAELMTETSWQPHSVRAYFMSLRKKGMALMRETRKDGTACYRITAADTDATTTEPQPVVASQSPEGADATGAAG